MAGVGNVKRRATARSSVAPPTGDGRGGTTNEFIRLFAGPSAPTIPNNHGRETSWAGKVLSGSAVAAESGFREWPGGP